MVRPRLGTKSPEGRVQISVVVVPTEAHEHGVERDLVTARELSDVSHDLRKGPPTLPRSSSELDREQAERYAPQRHQLVETVDDVTATLAAGRLHLNVHRVECEVVLLRQRSLPRRGCGPRADLMDQVLQEQELTEETDLLLDRAPWGGGL